MIPALASLASAQATTGAAIEGRIVDPDGLGVPGITVTLTGPESAEAREAVTAGEAGRFRFDELRAGAVYTLRAGGVGIYRPTGRVVATSADGPTSVELRLELGVSEQVTVTEAREGRLKKETPATVETIDEQVIDEVRPVHPGEVMARVPGVWVNTTGGEGHMASIRQPLTTNPVYLYLEDGVPTRSTGFFNHNALYEVNVPASAGIEVTKGPGSALYGSDAVGGVINVLTRSALEPSGASADVEAGGWGWRRLVAGARAGNGLHGVRADINLTRTDGWRDATDYDRQSASLRWDAVTAGGSAWKTLATYSGIDQQTAGSSTLPEEDYLHDPTLNLTPISFRAVEAFRLSTDYRRAAGATTWNLIPYFRYDTMDLLPNWSLPYDPTVYDTRNTSYGALAKVQRSLSPLRTELVAGFDVDLSPGARVENRIVPGVTTTPDGQRVFTSYTTGARIYDYDVTYLGLASYAQVDVSPTSRLRASAGLRLDRMSYDYRDNLTTPATPRHQRPADAARHYASLSPKLGVTYQFSSDVSGFLSYRRAFRAPSEGQLFRQGSTANTVDLEPVKAVNVEAGVRARLAGAASATVSVYRLAKRDDIVSFRDPLDGLTHAVNAGRTLHRGVEIGLDLAPAPWLRASASYAYARHTYDEWVVDPARGADYSGHEMEAGPAHMGHVALTVSPSAQVSASADLTWLGRYWMDAANTETYGGHVLVNLRGQVPLTRRIGLYARIQNVTDRRYAETSSYTLQRGRELAPGLPRTVYVGLALGWQR